MCNFHPSSFHSLCLQRKLVNTAKTGRQKKPHPRVAFVFGAKKKKNKKAPKLRGKKKNVRGEKETLNACDLTITNWALYTQSPFVLSHITFPFSCYEEGKGGK